MLEVLENDGLAAKRYIIRVQHVKQLTMKRMEVVIKSRLLSRKCYILPTFCRYFIITDRGRFSGHIFVIFVPNFVAFDFAKIHKKLIGNGDSTKKTCFYLKLKHHVLMLTCV